MPAEKKKPTDSLPKDVEPLDVVKPGHFGGRLLEAINDVLTDNVPLLKKPRKPPPQPTTGLKDVKPKP